MQPHRQPIIQPTPRSFTTPSLSFPVQPAFLACPAQPKHPNRQPNPPALPQPSFSPSTTPSQPALSSPAPPLPSACPAQPHPHPPAPSPPAPPIQPLRPPNTRDTHPTRQDPLTHQRIDKYNRSITQIKPVYYTNIRS